MQQVMTIYLTVTLLPLQKYPDPTDPTTATKFPWAIYTSTIFPPFLYLYIQIGQRHTISPLKAPIFF